MEKSLMVEINEKYDKEQNDDPLGSSAATGYIFTAKWSEEDKEFVGLCEKYPYLSFLDVEEWKALQGIMRLVTDILNEERKI